MDPADLKKLMDWAAASPVLEIEIVEADTRVHLVKSGAAPSFAFRPPEPEASGAADHLVVSPLPGLLYLKASPEAAPFVAVGQRIVAGDTVGLIEAMKMFNPVVSDISGVVTALLAEEGKEVVAGQPLVSVSLEAEASA